MNHSISKLPPEEIGKWVTKCPKTNHLFRGSDLTHMYLPNKQAMWWECPNCNIWHVFFCQNKPLRQAA